MAGNLTGIFLWCQLGFSPLIFNVKEIQGRIRLWFQFPWKKAQCESRFLCVSFENSQKKLTCRFKAWMRLSLSPHLSLSLFLSVSLSFSNIISLSPCYVMLCARAFFHRARAKFSDSYVLITLKSKVAFCVQEVSFVSYVRRKSSFICFCFKNKKALNF